ncbi:MAG: 50S ribosomal protein L28 [Dehalococcoidia bacterium]|nr:50S ribosomal protein L28 [Dehalococcoidia bacterium]MDZ4246270.1 50S ribosomal protein L28 [Dehalococcoidia bacterium]
MSRKCDICGKKPSYGSNVSHSKRHTNRRWLPNIHKSTITLDGVGYRVKICTRCMRTATKAVR